MAAEVFCIRNKFGYCKFGESCKYLHVNELCLKTNCDRSCSFRHPKECVYFKKYKNCKFGEWCRYDHQFCEKVSENSREYIKTIDGKYDEIMKEIVFLKTEILNLKETNSRLQYLLESQKSTKNVDTLMENNKNISENVIEIDDKFKCDRCNYQAKTERGLNTHIGKKHKQFMQIDGNLSSEDLSEDGDEFIDNNMELKVTFIDEDKISAEADLRKYYIGEIIPDYLEDIIFIEKESGEIYNGSDRCYNTGEFKIYTFTFKISKTFSWELIKNRMFTDKVKDLVII